MVFRQRQAAQQPEQCGLNVLGHAAVGWLGGIRQGIDSIDFGQLSLFVERRLLNEIPGLIIFGLNHRDH